MITASHNRFFGLEKSLGRQLISLGRSVSTKTWQALDVSDKPEMTPIELIAVAIELTMPNTGAEARAEIGPSLPWAEEHFLERVSGVPFNPPPSHEDWPYAQKNNDEHRIGGRFSHTYPERFWPKFAHANDHDGGDFSDLRGIRYPYGDLNDVVDLLKRDPLTRQAYLPVFFPEDTGQVHGQRIPCTLGYQFLIREGEMNVIYGIRSCDFLRHFRDDVYMAVRLGQWVREQLRQADMELNAMPMGTLIMNIGSLHVFEGDRRYMEKRYSEPANTQ